HAEKHEYRLPQSKSETADDQAGTEEQRCGCCRSARASAFDPRPAESGAQAEQDERGRECGVGRTKPPGFVREQRLDRTIERAPGIHGADTDMYGDRSYRNEPPVERRAGLRL